MELKLGTDLALYKQPIPFNFEELKGELTQSLAQYKGLVFTEETAKDAKKTRAGLNKLRTVIDDERKRVKNICMQSYSGFESQIKEVVAMIDYPIAEIDKQTKAFEEIKKQQKHAEIVSFFKDNVGKCADYITFEQAFNPRWLNATYAIGDVHNEIMAKFLQIEDDLKIIRDQKSDFEAEMLLEYSQQQSVNKALAKKMVLEGYRAKLEAEKAVVAKNETTEQPTPPRLPTMFHLTENGREELSGKQAEIVHQAFVPEHEEVAPASEETETIKVIFHDTTEAFRHEMKALTEKHSIRYGGLK